MVPLPFNIEKLRLCVITLLHSYEVAFIRFCVVTLCCNSTIADTMARLWRPSVIRPIVIHVMDHVPAVAVVADIAQVPSPIFTCQLSHTRPSPSTHDRVSCQPTSAKGKILPSYHLIPQGTYSPSGRHSTRPSRA